MVDGATLLMLALLAMEGWMNLLGLCIFAISIGDGLLHDYPADRKNMESRFILLLKSLIRVLFNNNG